MPASTRSRVLQRTPVTPPKLVKHRHIMPPRPQAVCPVGAPGGSHVIELRKGVKPHAGRQVHVVLDRLSTYDTPQVRTWLAASKNVTFQTDIKQLVDNNVR
jgi:hypothetical protein